MARYYEESPLLDIDWSGILGSVPKTNVGMVPYKYKDWERVEGVPQLGIDRDYREVEKTGYVQPRDERVKDLLGYSAYDKIKGVPQLGISDQLVRKTQPEYDRPEELEFGYDPNQPVPEGVYNTELNPYNPSSKFFPYETDYSGIMAATALQESGDPIYDIAALKDFTNLPPSMRNDAEYMRPESERLYGVHTNWPWSGKSTVGINVPKLEEKKGYIDSTLIHEARHYYKSQYGFDIGDLSKEEMHNLIYQFQGMFYKNPVDLRRIPQHLSKKEADAFMAMHKQGKKWYQDQEQGFGEKKLSGEEKWKMEQDRKERLRQREFEKMHEFGGSYGGGEGYTPSPKPKPKPQAPPGQPSTGLHYGYGGKPSGGPKPKPKPKPKSKPRHHTLAQGGPVRLRGGGIVGLDMSVSKPSLFQQLFDYGRNVASMQLGGGVTGAGTETSDSIPAMLSDGEFVMTAKSVKGIGGGNREKGFKKLNTMMKSAEGRAV